KDHPYKELNEKLGLKYTEAQAPRFVQHLRLMRVDELHRAAKLATKDPLGMTEHAYWHWPFMGVDPVVTKGVVAVLDQIVQQDRLWTAYLLDSERLRDLYLKET